jgi:hypothetical protein
MSGDFGSACADGRQVTVADFMNDLYASRTEADFEHMERKLREATPDEMESRGAFLAASLLRLRAMERAENFVGPIDERSA